MIVLIDTGNGPVEGWQSTSWRHGISQVGSGQVEGDPGLLDVSGLVNCQVDGTRFRWRVEDEDRTEDDGSVKRWSGRGIAADFERSVVLPAGYPSWSQRERESTGHPLAIWRSLALEAQERGRLSWLTIGFTATQDSNGDNWTETVDAELDPGVDLLSLLDAMCEVEGAEWIVDPDGTLRVAPQVGQDRSGEVVLFVGREQLSRSTRKSVRDVRGTVYLEASTGVSEASSSAGPDAGEIWLEGQDWSDPSSRSAVAGKIADQLGAGKVQVDVQVSSDCGLYERFHVGDLVGLDDGQTVSQARVVAAAVSQTDQPSVELTLVDQVELRRRMVERAIEAKADVKLAASATLQRRHGLVRADRIETGSLQADSDVSSADYVQGVSGWIIKGDGEVEFDRGTFRGTLEAVDGTFTGEITASQITSGTFDAVRIPNLSADKITSGTFSAVRIPNLSADKITSGTFDAVRIPNLSASKITTGTLTGVKVVGGSTTLDDDGLRLITGSGNTNSIRWVDSSGSTVLFMNASSGGTLFINTGSNSNAVSIFGELSTTGGLISSGGLNVSQSSFFDGVATFTGRISARGNEVSWRNPSATIQRGGIRAGLHSTGVELQVRQTTFAGAILLGASDYLQLACDNVREISSREGKDDIATWEADALSAVLDTRVVSYTSMSNGSSHVGFIAEELPPEVSPMGDSIYLSDVVAVAYRAIQQLVEEVRNGR